MCGEYLDVDIFPVFRTAQKKRGKRFKPTSQTMQRYNQRRRETELERLVLTNFHNSGLFFNLTWSDQTLPSNEKQARNVLNVDM